MMQVLLTLYLVVGLLHASACISRVMDDNPRINPLRFIGYIIGGLVITIAWLPLNVWNSCKN